MNAVFHYRLYVFVRACVCVYAREIFLQLDGKYMDVYVCVCLCVISFKIKGLIYIFRINNFFRSFEYHELYRHHKKYE